MMRLTILALLICLQAGHIYSTRGGVTVLVSSLHVANIFYRNLSCQGIFGVPEVEFLGYQVSATGTSPTPEKMFPPTDLTKPFRCFIWDTTCMRAMAQDIAPGYIPSIPGTDALKLDPFEIDYLRVEQDNFVIEIKDTKVYGLKNLIIDEIRSYRNLSLCHVVFRTDLLYNGFYKINGSLFFKPINGEGDYWTSLKNLEVELFIPYDIVKSVNDIEFINASNYNFRYDVKDNAQFRFDNLYYGNTERSELMHYVINLNWKFLTAQYGRTFVSNLIDYIAKAYKDYFRSTPLRILVEYQI